MNGRRLLYRFGGFTVDPANRQLIRGVDAVPLQPKSFDVLLLLVEHRHQVMTKSRLMQSLWPGQFVEESNLSQNIYLLRKALGRCDGADDYIKTIPKHGYQFVVEVEEYWEDEVELVIEERRRTRLIFEDDESEAHARPINSLAVLPLTNETADEKADFLCDGITESIINSLSQLSTLRVAARGAVFRYKGRPVDPKEVGHELGVRAVLTGRVLQFGDRLIIRTELTDAEGWQLWGAQYDRRPAYIVKLQQEVAEEIARQLQLKLDPRERLRLAVRHTDDPAAYQLYLKGRYFWNKMTPDSFQKAVGCFTEAICADPHYASAYAGLADCYTLAGVWGVLAPEESFNKGKVAAGTALKINDTLPDAHLSLALVRVAYDWDSTGAEREFERALELAPSSADARLWHANFLGMLGRFDEAIAESTRAHELDPLSVLVSATQGYYFYLARRYERALDFYRGALDLDPFYALSHYGLGRTYAQTGMYEEAIAASRKAVTYSAGNAQPALGQLGYALARAGRENEAREIIDGLRKMSSQIYVSPFHIAVVYAGLGEFDEAFAALDAAYQKRDQWLVWLHSEPIVDRLRPDPRFADLMKRVGFNQQLRR